MLSRCGCGPSDCQNWHVSGERKAATPLPGLALLTVQEAREEISLRPCGGNTAPSLSGLGGQTFNRRECSGQARRTLLFFALRVVPSLVDPLHSVLKQCSGGNIVGVDRRQLVAGVGRGGLLAGCKRMPASGRRHFFSSHRSSSHSPKRYDQSCLFSHCALSTVSTTHLELLGRHIGRLTLWM